MRKGLTTKSVLLLNADTSVLTTITLKRAILLYLSQKVTPLLVKDGEYMHPSIKIGYPSIMMLKSYIYVPRRSVPLTRRNIFLRDKNFCQYTGEKLTEKNATIDHVIPKSHKNFPGNSWKNLVACTKSINNMKGDKTPEEAGLKLIREPFVPKWDDLVLMSRPDWKKFIDDFRK